MKSLSNEKICYIQSSWHENIVNQLKDACLDHLIESGVEKSKIDIVYVPGALEIPLQAKLRAELGAYSSIIVAGLIVDGGIYRHEFVADAIIKSIMEIQLETRVPIIHSIMTPIHFHESGEHEAFFFKHFESKGIEAAKACIETIQNCHEVKMMTA